jgi:hypothetical protein
VGNLFQKPGQQASQGASQVQAMDQQMLNQLESYTGQQQQAERGAVAGVGANPYFAAAQSMNPGAYRVNPASTQTFGTSGPGTYLAKLHSISSGPQPAPWNPAGGGGNGASAPILKIGGSAPGQTDPYQPAGPGHVGNFPGGTGARGHENL